MAILGFPDGSLSERTRELLQEAGVIIPVEVLRERRYSFSLNSTGSSLFDSGFVVRPQDMPKAIFKRMVDAGFSGEDWFSESLLKKYLKVVATLNYSKEKIMEAPRIVVLGKPGESFHDTKETVVVSEYPKLARRRFKEARIIVVRGKAESWVNGGIAHFCVDLYDSGGTARANDLVIVGEPVISSPTILLARKDSSLLPAIKLFAQDLQEAFARLATNGG